MLPFDYAQGDDYLFVMVSLSNPDTYFWREAKASRTLHAVVSFDQPILLFWSVKTPTKGKYLLSF